MRDRFRPETTGTWSGSGADSFAVFVSAPSPSVWQGDVLAVRQAVDQWSACHPIKAIPLTAADAPTSDPHEKRSWILRILTGSVDGVIEIWGPSTGLGREDAIAAGQRCPRLLLVREDMRLSPGSGRDGHSHLDVARYGTPAELQAAVTDWLSVSRDALQSRRERRTRAVAEPRLMRQRALRAWTMLAEQRQRSLADLMGMTRWQLATALRDDVDFASLGAGDMLVLAGELNVWNPISGKMREPRPTQDHFTERQLRYLEVFTQQQHLDDLQVASVLEHAIRLQQERNSPQGQLEPARDPRNPNSAAGWRRIWEDLCAEQGN